MTSSACITSEYHLSLLSMSTECVLYFLTDFSHFMTKTLMIMEQIMSLNNFAQLQPKRVTTKKLQACMGLCSICIDLNTKNIFFCFCMFSLAFNIFMNNIQEPLILSLTVLMLAELWFKSSSGSCFFDENVVLEDMRGGRDRSRFQLIFVQRHSPVTLLVKPLISFH